MQDEDLSSLVTIHQNIPLADSREIAKRLDIDHRSFFRLVTEYQEEIEVDFGVLRFEITKRTKGSRGGRPERYALLTEEQTYAYMSYSQNTEAARKCKRQLVKAFMEAKAFLNETQSAQTGFLNNLWVARAQLFHKQTKIAADKFCVFRETTTDFFEVELKGCGLPEKALPDGSIGRRWCTYAREVLLLDMSLITEYEHHYPDKRGVQPAYLYPIAWLQYFRIWFKEVYIPLHLPEYLNYLKVPQEDIQKIMLGFGETYQMKMKKAK